MIPRVERPILVIEDNLDDQMLTRIAFRRAEVPNALVFARSAEEGLQLMLGADHSASRLADGTLLRPGLILMDVNLPGINGFECVRQLRLASVTRTLPIVMLTTSARPEDVRQCYLAGASSYVRKPVDLAAFVQILRDVAHYWLHVNVCPETSTLD